MVFVMDTVKFYWQTVSFEMTWTGNGRCKKLITLN